MTPDRQARYLARIGIPDRPRPTLADLRRLHRCHLEAVPFENLDIHLGVPIVLDPDALLTKLLDHRRGGFCYELNTTFGSLLESLGFTVAMLEARVGPDDPGVPFDHLCLEVLAVDDPTPQLVDVGFGSAFDEPLRIEVAVDQADSGGRFRLEDRSDGWIGLHRDDELQYRFHRRRRSLAEFEPGCLHHQTAIDSAFPEQPICTRRTPEGRVTVRGRALIEHTGDRRRERELEAAEFGTVLRDRFGIELSEADTDLLLRASASGWGLFDSPLGRLGVAWRGTHVIGVALPDGSASVTAGRIRALVGGDPAPADPPARVALAVDSMVELLSGRRRDLGDVRIDLDDVTDFDRGVYEVARTIPPGQVLTYGAVARRLGEPGAAQAVGGALGRNPVPLVVPCHRVVAADGGLGGFSAHGGVVTKRRLLEIEGAPIDRALFENHGPDGHDGC